MADYQRHVMAKSWTRAVLARHLRGEEASHLTRNMLPQSEVQRWSLDELTRAHLEAHAVSMRGE